MKSKFSSLIDILHFHASGQPNKTAYVFLEDGENESVRYTYGELDRSARAVAARLQEYSLAGQPVILLYPSTLEFLIAFLGCLYAKVVAVPVQLPGPNKDLDKIEAIIKNTGTQLVLSDTKALASLRKKAGSAP
ncbi:MAG: AMP-binding protein, partial [Bacteroidota bacterium]